MNKQDLYLPVIIGTARKERQSEKVARYVYEILKKQGVETKLIDIKDHISAETIPAWVPNEQNDIWEDEMSKADGIIVVVPEYNHGYPGELKIFLDSLYAEYVKKVAGICAVSSGGLGGARVVEQLIPVFASLEMTVVKRSVYFSNIEKLFSKDGVITDNTYEKRLESLFEDVIWYAHTLRSGRKQ